MLTHIQAIWKNVDVVFGNEEEFKQLGINHGFTDEDLGVVAQKLAALEKTNPNRKRICVITRGKFVKYFKLGKLSTIVASADRIDDYPIAYFVEVEKIVDANAAGDSFAGGFISQLLQGDDYKQCVLGG